MKPHMDNLAVVGNLPGQSRKFQIDPRAIAHLLKMLTGLYSNVELAVVRELATNAIDSHIQAGITDPIEVTTPSALSNFLVIRDHGVGLSVEELFGLFSMYGASTKRESDEVTGMLGVGSKSPLAYGDTFTMIARKDGVEATVAVTKDEDGVGRLNVVDTCTTSERNGVEIRVPAKSGNSFQHEAEKLFKYWEPGTILLNGKEPRPFEGLDLGDGMWLVKHDRHSEGSIVIQGRVPYPGGDALSTYTLNLPYGYAAVVRVPIGTVDPAPSRELLEFSQRTKAALAKVATKFQTSLQTAIQSKLDGATTKFEAMQIWHEWSAVTGGRHGRPTMVPQWNGQDLTTKLTVPTKQGTDKYGYKTQVEEGHMYLVSRTRGGRGSAQKVPSTDVTYLLKSVFVTNYTIQSFTSRHRDRLMTWFESQPDSVKGEDGDGHHHVNHFVLLDFAADLSWVPAERIVDWAVIKAIKLPTTAGTAGASGRISGSYDLYVGPDLAPLPAKSGNYQPPRKRALTGIPGGSIDQTHPVYFMHGNHDDARRVALTLDAISTKWTIVCLGENRLAKFERENKTIPNVHKAIQAMAAKELPALNADELMALAMEVVGDRNDFNVIGKYAAQIDDPAIVEAIRLSRVSIDKAIKLRQRYARSAELPLPEWENPMAKYILIDNYALRSDAPHVVRYMNAEYAYQQKGAKP